MIVVSRKTPPAKSRRARPPGPAEVLLNDSMTAIEPRLPSMGSAVIAASAVLFLLGQIWRRAEQELFTVGRARVADSWPEA